MSKSWSKGSTTRWRKIRRAVLARNQVENQGRCVLAIPKVCTGKADQVHHTQGRAVTGDDPRYLVACCRACNLHIGQPGRRSPPHRSVSSW